MVFVDVGCGEGFFAIPAARRIGPKGRVYAVDVDAGAVERLLARAGEEGLENVHARAGEAETTVFCDGCADIVFFGIDLHDFRDPAAVLGNASRMMKPVARLADLDWRDEPMPLGPPQEIRLSPASAAALIGAAGLRVISVQGIGPYHYLVIAGK